MSRFRRYRAFIVWAVVALLWANLPYLLGYASSTPQNQFGGFFLYEQDGYSYLAKMRQGAQGAWEFHLPYTSEDQYQTGGFVYPFYLILGKLAPLGLSYPLLYHGSRLLSSLLLLIVLARFIARFVSDQRWQVWTWWLLLFSGGWGLLASLFFNQKYVAYELIAPDAFVFSMLYGTPHVILGFALFLIWIGYMLDTLSAATDAQRVNGWPWRRIVIASGLGLFTALSREAYGPAFAGIFGAYLIALLLQRRKIPWREGSSSHWRVLARECMACISSSPSAPAPASPRGQCKMNSPRPISLTSSSALRRLSCWLLVDFISTLRVAVRCRWLAITPS